MEWRAIPGYEGIYEVSEAGQVRSVDRIVHFADGRTRRYTGQALVQYVDENGYPKVTLKKQDRGTRVHVHVLLAAAFIGPRPEGLQVCHDDGNPANCTRGNVRYDTPKGNHADKFLHGTQPLGELVPVSKLKPEQVRAIRAARGKKTARQLAEQFGTSPANVCNIQRGKRWAHLEH